MIPVSHSKRTFPRKRRRLGAAFALAMLCIVCPAMLRAQAKPIAGQNFQEVYHRLLEKINRILIFDAHAHPGFSNDPNVDAMASTPSHPPFRVRESNPEFVAAAQALFGYPYADFSPAHRSWLLQRMAPQPGVEYWDHILDECGIEVSLANRAAMANYLDPKRFRWVFFVDSFLFPLNNKDFIDRNPDEAVYIPLQQKMLHRYMKQAGIGRLPDTLSAYLAFITRVLEQNKKKGGIAIKFEIAYFRSLYFADPSRAAASAVYRKYCHGGLPSPSEYKTLQDFLFRYLVREGGRLRLPVNIHTAVGTGDYFSLKNGNVLNLENILRDPRYLGTTFVLLHGGYPYSRQAIWLAAMPNVYLDSSEFELLLYPSQFTRILKYWLEIYPEKILFGSDAYPYTDVIGAEETYWLGTRTARASLAAALAEMVSSGEVSETKALAMAHAYLHDTAAGLYASPSR